MVLKEKELPKISSVNMGPFGETSGEIWSIVGAKIPSHYTLVITNN